MRPAVLAAVAAYVVGGGFATNVGGFPYNHAMDDMFYTGIQLTVKIFLPHFLFPAS